jgi:hypothetical protein
MTDPQWISAVAACIAAGAAAYAAFTWKMTLREQRADDCIGAARGLSGALGRCISLKNAEAELRSSEQIWRAYDQVWASHLVSSDVQRGTQVS